MKQTNQLSRKSVQMRTLRLPCSVYIYCFLLKNIISILSYNTSNSILTFRMLHFVSWQRRWAREQHLQEQHASALLTPRAHARHVVAEGTNTKGLSPSAEAKAPSATHLPAAAVSPFRRPNRANKLSNWFVTQTPPQL